MDLVEPQLRREAEADLVGLVGAELIAASAIIGIALIEPVLLIKRPLDGDMGGPERRQAIRRLPIVSRLISSSGEYFVPALSAP